MSTEMTSTERVMAALSHKKVDRLPLFLMLSLYGAKENNVTPKEYFNNPSNVIDTQLRMSKKYKNDCLCNFFYAGLEAQAFGGEVIFADDGPPNTGEPIITYPHDIDKLTRPVVTKNPHLQ